MKPILRLTLSFAAFIVFTAPTLARAAKSVEQELAALSTAEEELLTEKAGLEATGQTAEQLQSELTRLLDGFDDRELRAVLSGDHAAISVAGPEKAGRIRLANELAESWNKAQGAYQEKLDAYTNSELDYFIKSTMVAVRALAVSRDGAAPAQLSVAALASYAKAKRSFSAYVLSRKNFGGPKDGPQRTGAYREFFAQAKSFFDSVQPLEEKPLAKKFWTRMKEKAALGYARARLVATVAPPVLKTLVLSWTQSKSAPGEAPLQTRGMHEVFRAINRIAGYRVQVEGREFLPKGNPLVGKKITLVVPTHRNPMLDGILMSALDLKSYLLVMSPMPLLGDVDTMVAVRHGAKPIERVLEQLAAGKTDTILVYPEGSVGAGLLETRPVREKFVSGLLTTLRDAGYDVDLVPVTYVNSARFVDQNSIGAFFSSIGSESGTTLNAKVGTPIDSRIVTLLESAGSHAAVARFLRATWLEALPTDSRYLNGALRLRPAAERFRTLLTSQPASCRALFLPSN
jgi:1-acyl-sn-glycerol-3-phosphate acyltransferase